MDADEYCLTLCELMADEFSMPLHQKLAMTEQQCQQWLRNLYAKRLTLRDAQQTVRTVVEQKARQDDEDLDEILHYV